MFSNHYLEDLGAVLPIVQAPMANAQGAKLAAAVSAAGGIGSVPGAMLTPEKLREELIQVRNAAGGKPYTVNFFAHANPLATATQKLAWMKVIQPYLTEFDLLETDIPSGGGRNPFDEHALQVVEEIRPPVVSFHFGLPKKKLLDAVKAAGAQIWSSATTVAEAIWLAENGADAVIAQGWEAGGHRGWFLNRDPAGQSGLFALLPNIINSISLPVIAAGGISNAQTVRAALDLGAAGIQAGTAFLLAEESSVSDAYRTALQSEAAGNTVMTNLFSGGYARGISNRFIREAGPVNPDALPFPLNSASSATLRFAAEKRGDYGFSSFWAGQNARLARPGSAAEILQWLAEGIK